jgi:hypothetical protein
MLRISLRFYLLADIIAMISICILHKQFGLTAGRFISAVMFSSLFSIPAIIIANTVLHFIKSLRLRNGGNWIVLLISILLISHLATSMLVALGLAGPDKAELLWLVINGSSYLALLFQFSTFYHLLKTFGYETRFTTG